MREGASLETGELHPDAGKKRRSKRRTGGKSYKSGCRVEGMRDASEPGERSAPDPVREAGERVSGALSRVGWEQDKMGRVYCAFLVLQMARKD